MTLCAASTISSLLIFRVPDAGGIRSCKSIVIGPMVTCPRPGLFAGSGPPSHVFVVGRDSGIAIDSGSTCAGTAMYGNDVVMLVFASGSFCDRKSCQIAEPLSTP